MQTTPILIYEDICGGGWAHQVIPDDLLAEGAAMLRAAIADALALPGVTVITTRDARLTTRVPLPAAAQVCTVSQPEVLPALVAQHPNIGVLLIAPECDHRLHKLATLVVGAGGQLLGPSPLAIALTTDKLATEAHLRSRGLPVVTTLAADPFAPSHATFDLPLVDDWPVTPATMPVVIKPRDGVGTQATRIVDSPQQWPKALAEVRRLWSGALIVQAYHAGLPASNAVIATPPTTPNNLPGEVSPLLAGEQTIARSDDGTLHYRGGVMPLSGSLADRAAALAVAAVATIPGAAGYCGVDLILGDTSADDRILEINPRLTTSYVALRALSAVNLLGLISAAVRQGRSPRLIWRNGQSMTFHAV